MARHVKFLALAYDGKILATHTHWDKEASEDYEGVIRQIFASPGWAAVRENNKSKLELKSGANIYSIELDTEGRTYVAVVTDAYPIGHVFSGATAGAKLMNEFRDFIATQFPNTSLASPDKGLRRTLKPFLKELATRFDDLDSIDKIHNVQKKVDSLRESLVRNIAVADERHSLLERQEVKGTEMASAARKLFQAAHNVKRSQRSTCCRKYMSWIIVAVVAAVLLAGIVLVILNFTTFHWFAG